MTRDKIDEQCIKRIAMNYNLSLDAAKRRFDSMRLGKNVKRPDNGYLLGDMYTEDQVKNITLAFYEYLPQHDSIHTESCFDAWFERYGCKI